MRKINYEYIARSISKLTRIQIRVYHDHDLILNCDPASFPKDPAAPYIDILLSIDRPVSYCISDYDQFYGVIRYDEYTMILGPTFQLPPPREKIREFMFSLGIKKDYMDLFQSLYLSITPMPLELFLQELCMIYYFLSEEETDISHVAIYDSNAAITNQNRLNASAGEPVSMESLPDFPDNTEGEHSATMDFEKKMLGFISAGDIDGLNAYFKNNSAGRAGKVAPTYIRQLKNIFITTVTLVSRAAIEGGMSAEEALSLSDRYIQHAESYSDPEQIMNLQYNMILDYTGRVNKITNGSRYDRFMRDVTAYVQSHLSDSISEEAMARDLFLSRSYLSSKFKAETGRTLSEYIQEQRIGKAKDLLKNTQRSILEISTYLNFSSQGYFQNVFKKQTGMTPGEYRRT